MSERWVSDKMGTAGGAKQTGMTKEGRQREILAEATRFIGERGYFGFTVHELARRCGLTSVRDLPMTTPSSAFRSDAVAIDHKISPASR